MSGSDAAGDTSPRLGWLEAFVASAQCRNFEQAGRDLGLRSSAERTVERLQIWLHRVLFTGDVPLELVADDGMPPFLPVAKDILDVFYAHSCASTQYQRHNLKKSNRSLVRLLDLKTVIVVVENGNFDAAAAEIGCAYKVVRDRVKTVEAGLGGSIFAGRSTLVTTDLGTPFIDAARRISRMWEGARADISGYVPGSATALKLYRSALSRRVEIVGAMRNGRKSNPMRADDVAALAEQLRRLDQLISEMGSRFDLPANPFDYGEGPASHSPA